MTVKSHVPSAFKEYYDDWNMSPGLEANGFIFFTGFTGAAPDGTLSSIPKEQIVHAFEKVALVLKEANLDFSHVVEMTTYHIGLREHLEDFKNIRSTYVVEPYPAWTAIEVAGFVREGAVVEIRVIARRED